MLKIKLSNDNSEIIPYNFNDFEAYAKRCMISYYPGMASANHWHNDFEFTILLKGHMSYSINGESYKLKEGQGIFVNSNQMHYGYSSDGSDCNFVSILIHPSLISIVKRIKENYVLPICKDTSHPLFILYPYIGWQNEIIEMLKNIYTLFREKKDGFELHVMSIFYSLFYILYHNMKNNVTEKKYDDNKNLKAMHDMIGYMQKNYKNKITLSNIASAGNVCRSSCFQIFQLILNKTPISYLTEYRLEKSIDLLKFTSLSITEIALKCGFSGSSYFTEIFRKNMGCTPSQYRKNC
ncbi:AraC family transcriptional regulator [Clostridium sp. CT7]|nr:AraC family transcriptional regulator [Clostridium sp. CT7]